MSSSALAHVPSAPRTPSAAAQRLIFSYGAAQSVLLIMGVVFTLMGSLFVAIFADGALADLALNASARIVTGRIVSSKINRSAMINNRHPYTLTFDYNVDGTTLHGHSSTLDDTIVHQASVGQAFEVEVVPWHPAWARIVGTNSSVFGVFGLIPSIFLLIGLAFIGGVVVMNRRRIRAFTTGSATAGRVVYRGPHPTLRVNGRHPHLIRWELTVSGKTYKGSLSSTNGGELDAALPGEEIVVLYVPEDPGKNVAFIA